MRRPYKPFKIIYTGVPDDGYNNESSGPNPDDDDVDCRTD